jgi:hypothetical protein
MKFIAFGDSFTQGFSTGLTENESKEISFVNQIRHYTTQFTEYVNYAVTGSSNTQIAYKVYEWAKTNNTENCFVFVGWTTFIRDSTWINDEYKRTGNSNKFSFFRKTKIEKLYLPDSVKRQLFDTERDILATSKLLEQLNIPYCMIQGFDDHTLVQECLIGKQLPFPNWINWNKRNNTMIDICYERYLADIVHSEYGKNHKQFSLSSKYLTACKHPNTEGHILIAKTLASKLKV